MKRVGPVIHFIHNKADDRSSAAATWAATDVFCFLFFGVECRESAGSIHLMANCCAYVPFSLWRLMISVPI